MTLQATRRAVLLSAGALAAPPLRAAGTDATLEMAVGAIPTSLDTFV